MITIYLQGTGDDRWIFWINASNHAPLARSCRKYSRRDRALSAARKVVQTDDVLVEYRTDAGEFVSEPLR